ncbi:amino acid adenylation domain-containing protein [Streptomyces sp. NPDC007259]|uniref:non-ribosomal peptide synthetase/type I polyketide synthase n=1 Tax=Streptomyces sp. NPDC007259 TaxID=3154319 RepID=UPI00345732E8
MELFVSRETAVEVNSSDIAIVGMAIRCPGASDLDEFWENLRAGVESISFFAREELEESAFFPVDTDSPRFVPAAGIVPDVDKFDAPFFGISRAEAEMMDPQHRVFLETVWSAMENSGSDLTSLDGNVSIYAGSASNTYLMSLVNRGADTQLRSYQGLVGNEKDYLATRASFKLNLAGESITVQTACSTSLVAVHLACQSLLSGQSDVAIAGGVSLQAYQKTGYIYQEDAIFSPDGHCRAFDRDARGTVFSNGVGAVVLKPLDAAVRDGDRIYSVIKGSFVNNDASAKVSYTAPSVEAQAAVVAGALAFADVTADTVGYVETHGTATELGDPIEIEALTQAFRADTDEKNYCGIGSLKTNIGHLNVAAGVAGLIKTALILHHKQIPASLHFESPNPEIDFDNSPFYVNAELRDWADTGAPRRAGVSSFGIGGTNAHVVLEEAPQIPRTPPAVRRSAGLLTVSARSEGALRDFAGRHSAHLRRYPQTPLADYGWTAAVSRRQFRHRLAVSGGTAQDLADALDRYARGEAAGLAAGEAAASPPSVAFVFSGQDGLAPGAVSELLDAEPAFREALDECAELLRPWLDAPLHRYLDQRDPLSGELSDPRVGQPVLFAIEYALTRMWTSYGLRPAAVLGHGPGACVAACVAGAISLRDGIELAAAQGRAVAQDGIGRPVTTAAADAFGAALDGIAYTTPTVPLVSAVDGALLASGDVPATEYWVRHLRAPASFAQGVEALTGFGCDVILEIGPAAELSAQGAVLRPDTRWLSSLDGPQGQWNAVLGALGALYVEGVPVDWDAVHAGSAPRRAAGPGYPFERQRYWIDRTPAPVLPTEPVRAPAQSPADRSTAPAAEEGGDASGPAEAGPEDSEQIGEHLRSLISELLGVSAEEVDSATPLLDLGLDSMAMLEAVEVVESTYGVELKIRRLMDDMNTLDAITAHVAGSLPGRASVVVPGRDRDEQGPEHEAREPAPQVPEEGPAARVFVPYRPIKVVTADEEGPQPRYVEDFVARYTARTQGSKQSAQRFRRSLADNDNRVLSNFRMSVKEMVYPIVADRSAGSRLWDVDGNEYVDVVMGFGVNLFGHSPSFVTQAVMGQLKKGVHLGAQSDVAGRVAELTCGLTGAERVVFCNSGSEAVMHALRLARAATGRTKVAMFAGSYHGTFDGTLGRPQRLAAGTAPLAPGVSQHMVDDLIVLDYDRPESLEKLRAHRHELAAVLVEPVQSRRPDVQPKAFLRDLRKLTTEVGAVLVFDEIITGFRSDPGGAQAWFGVKADLAVYGKVLGGGLPIGAVAGRAAILDAVDGGVWNYGDDSYPAAPTTFFAGTFCKHPLAMASALSVLTELDRRGPVLQRELNARTERFARTVNEGLAGDGIPIRMVTFSSLFRFTSQHDIHMLYYHLVDQGIHIREGHNAFLSVAHTDEDVERIAAAVLTSARLMAGAGLIPHESEPRPAAESAPELLAEPAKAAEPAGRAEPVRFPLTPAQRQLWTLANISPEASAAYHQNTMLRLTGDLDVGALRGAFARLVDRHEALRTVFHSGGEYQEVLPAAPAEVTLLALPDGAGQDEGAAVRLVSAEAERPFDLATGPLIRLAVVPLGERSHLLHVCAHHIVADGISIGVLLEELAALYSAAGGAGAPALPDPVPFRQHGEVRAAGEAAAPAGAGREAAEAHWMGRLRGPLPKLELPPRSLRPAAKTYAGARHVAEVDTALAERLRGLAAARGVTPFMLLITAYAALLHRLTGQTDLVIGVPVSGRTAPGTGRVVGHCVNLLAPRFAVAGESRFGDLLTRAKGDLLDDFEHQDLPFASLAEKVGVPMDPARAPLADVLFNLDRAFTAPELEGLSAEHLAFPVRHAQFDLELNVVTVGQSLRLEFTYSTDLFDEAVVAAWAEHLLVLLRGVTERPDARIAELPLHSAEQRTRVLDALNDVAPVPVDQPLLHRAFEEWAARTPDAPCVSDEEGTLTYGELNVRADRLADRLRGLGVAPETVVGVHLGRTSRLFVAVLGVLKAGGVYLPLSPDSPAERLAFMVEESGASVVLTEGDPDRWPAGSGGRARVVSIDGLPQVPAGANPQAAGRSHAHSAAYVMFTSGSTGRPKAVVGTHAATSNRIAWMEREHPLRPGELCCQKTAIGFVDSVWELFAPLTAGASTVVLPDQVVRDPRSLLGALRDYGVSRLVVVPALLRALLDSLDRDNLSLPALSLVVTSGEAASADLVRRCASVLPDAVLLNLYGSTEVSADATAYDCRELPPGSHTVPAGRPIAGNRAYVLDAGLRISPIGAVGELYIAGEGLARGYATGAATAERFLPDPFSAQPGARMYRMGDLARYRLDGTVDVLGRADRQTKIRGMRVEPGEVEAVLEQHPRFGQAAVVSQPGPDGSPRLVAFLVPHGVSDADGTQGALVDSRELRRFCAARLPDHMIPSAYTLIDRLPTTRSGKIDRHLLEAEAVPEPESVGSTAPGTPVEQVLHDLWCEVLGRRAIGVEENFLDLGGDSLMAIRLVGRIQERLGVEVGVRDLLISPTIAHLAATVEKELLGASADSDFDAALQALEDMDEAEAQRLLQEPGTDRLTDNEGEAK